ncbi:hypothetical protein PVK06_002163 [Gossypium arboreum]|uniref:Pentatricopeptide repeat-containing protein n=2 Tax=Gossypium arboreum TaxID=29729 RepID=A0ABR0R494_GOSAR|nr:hypothetical protein PVK06_002163 [Gossypium arboreum]
MCTSPAVHPSNCGINDDMDARKGKTSSAAVVVAVTKWMLNKGQGAMMGIYDTLLLAFDMDNRVDEARSLWNIVLHTHNRSISKRLFSRMISLFDHHSMPNKIIKVFADMEKLCVRLDETTVRKVYTSDED